MEKTDLKRRIQLQNLIIITLTICIVVLLCVSFTAAWYIRTKTSSIDIILSDPVNVNVTINDDITNEFKYDFIIDTGNSRVYPGDRIKLKLGLILGAYEASSPAYVRVKMEVKLEDTTSDNEDSYVEDSIISIDQDPSDTDLWTEVNFGTEDVQDRWYVLCDNPRKAKTAVTGDSFTFVDGWIELNKRNMTNAYANKKLNIVFKVEAIQTENVSDPLAYPDYGPWWGNDDEYPGT